MEMCDILPIKQSRVSKRNTSKGQMTREWRVSISA